MVIPSQSTGKHHVDDNDGSERYDQEEQDPENEEEYSPGDTSRANLEIIEASAIFIQKNYRGYRTRKLLRQYFEQLCEEDQFVNPNVQQQIHGKQLGRYSENDEDEDNTLENKIRSANLGNFNFHNYDNRNEENEEIGEEEYIHKNPLQLEEGEEKNEFNFLKEKQKNNIIQLLAL